MRFVPRADWDPRLAERPEHASVADALRALAHFDVWPSVEAIGAVLHAHGVTNAAGEPLVPEEQAPKTRRSRRAPEARSRDALYDARIDGAARLPTRSASYHDLFNALVWASFPRTKARISARQHAAWQRLLPLTFERLPSARTREQDALAMLDEGGILVATRASATLVDALRRGDRGPLDDAQRARAATPWVFGHALHEHFVSSDAPVRAALLFVDVAPDAPRAEVDATLAAWLAAPGTLVAPDTLASLELRGRTDVLCTAR